MSTLFLLTSLLVVASPGTGALFTISAGLHHGGRAGVIAATGCAIGILPHLLAAALGLATVLHSSVIAFTLLKSIGAAYLVYMAWRTLRDARFLQLSDTGSEQGAARIIGSAVLINLLNPKLSVFFLAFLPQFIPASVASPMVATVTLGAAFMTMTWVVFVFYGYFAATMRAHVLSRPQLRAWLSRSFAACFALLGVRLLISQQH